MTAVPNSSSVFCTIDVRPSVTSCSSASMSLVRREISRRRGCARSSRARGRWMWREEVAAQVGEHALADPGREVRLRDRGAAADERRRRRTRRVQRRARCRSPGTMPRSIANLASSGASRPTAVRRAARPREDRLARLYGRDEREEARRAGGTCRCHGPSPRAASTPTRRAADVTGAPPAASSPSSATNVRSTRPCVADLGVDRVASRRARRARPRATIRPSSSTTIWSASAIVESRCAMMIVVRPAITSCERDADPRLGGGVDGCGRVVEDQDPRIGEQRAGDREALALAAREREPALADDGVLALRAAPR